ncbi:hypothetical protein HK096_005443, partial [Nowakowskiella sp. JEL0078]
MASQNIVPPRKIGIGRGAVPGKPNAWTSPVNQPITDHHIQETHSKLNKEGIPLTLGVNVRQAVANLTPNNPQVVHLIHHFPQTDQSQFPARGSTDLQSTPIQPQATSKPRPRKGRVGEDNRNMKESSEDIDALSDRKSETLTLRNASQPQILNSESPTQRIHLNQKTAHRYRPYPGPLTITNTPHPESSHPASPEDPHAAEEQTVYNFRQILSLLSFPFFPVVAVEVLIDTYPSGSRFILHWGTRIVVFTRIAIISIISFGYRILIDPIIRNRNEIFIIFIILTIRATRILEFLTSPSTEAESERSKLEENRLWRLWNLLNILNIDYSEHPVQKPLFLNAPVDKRITTQDIVIDSELSYLVNNRWYSRLPGKSLESDTVTVFSRLDELVSEQRQLKTRSKPLPSIPPKLDRNLDTTPVTGVAIKDDQPKRMSLAAFFFPKKKEEKLQKEENSTDEIRTQTPTVLVLPEVHESTATLLNETPLLSPVSSQAKFSQSTIDKDREYLEALAKAGIKVPRPSTPQLKSTGEIEQKLHVVTRKSSLALLTPKTEDTDSDNEIPSAARTLRRTTSRASVKSMENLKNTIPSAKSQSPKSTPQSSKVSSPVLSKQNLPIASPIRQSSSTPNLKENPEAIKSALATLQNPLLQTATVRSFLPENRLDLSNKKLISFPPPNMPPTSETPHGISGLGPVVHYPSMPHSDLIPPMITLSSLETITHLYLNNNLISELHNNTIASMPRLVCLDVSGNNLLSLPASIGGLTELRELYAGLNRIRFVPHELSMLSTLE